MSIRPLAVHAVEILDSRLRPTLATDLITNDGHYSAGVPAGAFAGGSELWRTLATPSPPRCTRRCGLGWLPPVMPPVWGTRAASHLTCPDPRRFWARWSRRSLTPGTSLGGERTAKYNRLLQIADAEPALPYGLAG